MSKDGLSGRVALVTGGGRGLGEATCQALAGAGASVIVADIRMDLASRAAEAISAQGGRAVPLRLDVTDPAGVEDAMRKIIEEHRSLDVLINNAGVDITVPIEELTLEDWDRILAVNLTGPFILSRNAFPIMKGQGRGHIINIASTASKRAWANALGYHASKWGLLGFSHALHVEGRPHGIKVTALVCGGMRTPFLLDRFPDLHPGLLQDPANVARTIVFILGQPDETVIPEMMVLPMKETSWP